MGPVRSLVFIGVLSVMTDKAFAQRSDYGALVVYNSSSQTNFDPTMPEDGTFQWNALGTWGAGAYYARGLSRRWASRVSVLYQQKGYRELAQVGDIPGGPIYDWDLRNRFTYLSADLAVNFSVIRARSFSTCLNLGMEYSYLLAYEIESDVFPINAFYPVNAYQDNWEKHNLSILPSVSFVFNEATTMELGFNRSLLPVLQTDNLVVKDWIWSIRVSQSVAAFLKRDG